jgi:hypothetical protein
MNISKQYRYEVVHQKPEIYSKFFLIRKHEARREVKALI